MLSKKEKAVMKVIYYASRDNKDYVSLLQPLDIYKSVPYTLDVSPEEIEKIIKELELDDYYDLIVTEKKGETVYCFTLHQKGVAFYRELAKEKRVIISKVILTVGGVIGAFLLKSIIELLL